MKKLLLVTFILLSLSGVAHSAGNSKWGTIKELYFGTAGDYVRVSMNVNDSQQFCGQSGKPYVLYLDQSS